MTRFASSAARFCSPAMVWCRPISSCATAVSTRSGARGKGLAIDATGLLVLPGIVDIHGDAFDVRSSRGPAWISRSTSRCGIPSGSCSPTASPPPSTASPCRGSRGCAASRPGGAADRAGGGTLDLRHAGASAVGGVQPRRAGHRAGGYRGGTGASAGVQRPHRRDPRRSEDPVEGAKYAGRAGMTMDAFRAFTMRSRRGPLRFRRRWTGSGPPRGPPDSDGQPRRRFACRARAVPRSRRADLRISDGREVGHDARAGRDVVMGSPTLSEAVAPELGLRGGDGGGGDLRHSVVGLLLPGDGASRLHPCRPRQFDLPRAWALISTNPAAATGLTDRGTIEAGKRADLLLIEPVERRLVATIASGRMAHVTAEGVGRLAAR